MGLVAGQVEMAGRAEPPQTRRKVKLPAGLEVYSLAVLVFLFLPVSMIVLFSFNTSPAGVFPLAGFTFDWYTQVFTDPLVVAAARRSAGVATATALVSAVLGTLCSLGLVRYRFRFKQAFQALLVMPMILPGLLLGVALLTYFAALGIRRSLITVALSHIVFSVPYVVFIVSARLQEFDRAIEEAAGDLGANPWQVFRRVTFPLIGPSVIGAMLIVFAWSFDDFIVSFFTIGAEPTLPILIWGMLRRGTDPTINALATLLLTATVTATLAARRIGRVQLEF